MTAIPPASPSTSPRGDGRLVLLTGASGFLGRHVAAHLHADGFRVRALARDPARLMGANITPDEVHVGDLGDPDSLRGACDGVEAVIHTACAVAGTFDAGQSALNLFLRVNRDGTAHLAREALRHPGLRFVHTSSTAVMGAPRTPVVNETSPCHPRTPYQVSKFEAERALDDLARDADLNFVVLRPCVISGEGKSGSELLTLFRLVKRGVFPLIGNRRDVRKPLVVVDDVARALIRAVDHGDKGARYLITSGARHTMGEILDVAARLVGARRGYVPLPVTPFRAATHVFRGIGRVFPNWNPPITTERLDLFLTDRHIDISQALEGLGYAPLVTTTEAILERSYNDFTRRGIL